MMKKKLYYYILIMAGASLWGLIGVFVNKLASFGYSSMEIVMLRVVSGFIIMLLYVFLKNKKLLVIHWKDMKYFIGTGILSVVFFNWCYFTSIKETSLSIAVILLYTAPAFVTVLSVLFLKEKITAQKLTALCLTILGCVFVTGLTPFSNTQPISFYGVLIGLGAGFGYALYSIFSKLALTKYNTYTITTYTFLFATVGLLPTTNVWGKLPARIYDEVWLYIIGLGLIPTVAAYLLYTKGLSGIESSKASIVATIEPIVATIIGIWVFGESLTFYQIVGCILVLFSVIIVQLPTKKTKEMGIENHIH
jgi:drug/metabolite transporter (DMT)-like permease